MIVRWRFFIFKLPFSWNDALQPIDSIVTSFIDHFISIPRDRPEWWINASSIRITERKKKTGENDSLVLLYLYPLHTAQLVRVVCVAHWISVKGLDTYIRLYHAPVGIYSERFPLYPSQASAWSGHFFLLHSLLSLFFFSLLRQTIIFKSNPFTDGNPASSSQLSFALLIVLPETAWEPRDLFDNLNKFSK